MRVDAGVTPAGGRSFFLPNVIFVGLSFSCDFLLLFTLLQVGWSSSVGKGTPFRYQIKKIIPRIS
jgi:hypothetical protein